MKFTGYTRWQNFKALCNFCFFKYLCREGLGSWSSTSIGHIVVERESKCQLWSWRIKGCSQVKAGKFIFIFIFYICISGLCFLSPQPPLFTLQIYTDCKSTFNLPSQQFLSVPIFLTILFFSLYIFSSSGLFCYRSWKCVFFDIDTEREGLMVDSSSATTKIATMATSPCLSGIEKKYWWLSNRKVLIPFYFHLWFSLLLGLISLMGIAYFSFSFRIEALIKVSALISTDCG